MLQQNELLKLDENEIASVLLSLQGTIENLSAIIEAGGIEKEYKKNMEHLHKHAFSAKTKIEKMVGKKVIVINGKASLN